MMLLQESFFFFFGIYINVDMNDWIEKRHVPVVRMIRIPEKGVLLKFARILRALAT